MENTQQYRDALAKAHEIMGVKKLIKTQQSLFNLFWYDRRFELHNVDGRMNYHKIDGTK